MLNRDYDFAFYIKEMGLFFLNISINQMGDLIAFLQIVNCNSVCRQFTYTFETIGGFNTSYSGPVRLYPLLFVYLYKALISLLFNI